MTIRLSGWALLLICLAGCTGEGEEGPPRIGRVVRVIGEKGIEPGLFSKPRVVASGPKSIYVIDMTGRIQRFSPDGTLETHWRTPAIKKGKPVGAAWSPEDVLIVADTHYHRLIFYERGGRRLVRDGETGASRPAKEGEFSFGSYGTEPGQFIYPTDIGFGSDGNWYVSEYGGNDRIQVFPSWEPRQLREWGELGPGPKGFERISSMVFGPVTGRLYAVDTGHHRIQIFDTDGTLLDTWGELGQKAGQFQYPYGIATDEEERIYVSEFGNHRIQVLDRTGRSLGVFGEVGTKKGQFNTPRGIDIAPDGTLWVSDGENHRIQVIAFPWTGR